MRSYLRTVAMVFPLIVLFVHTGVSSGQGDWEPTLKVHGPIYIDGPLSGSMLPDGVTGNGTPEDPFLIYGFWFNTTLSPGIVIRNCSENILVDYDLFVNGRVPKYPGILIENSSNIWVRNVAAYYCTQGIEIRNGTNITISDSGFFASYDGIRVQGRNLIIERVICKVNVENGIMVNRSSNVTIRGAIAESNTAILGWTSGIHLLDSYDVDIIDTTTSLNYGFGILVESPDNLSISENIRIIRSYVDTNNNGLVMSGVRNSTVEETCIQYNTNGIHLSSSSYFQIKECDLYKNTYGIFLSYSSDVEISGSEFDRNENAVYLDSTERSSIHHNVFSNGTWHAITIDTWLGMGPPSRYNWIFANQFDDNGPKGCQAMDNGQFNIWYNGTLGNRWSDHWGPDEDNDSIVDEPYLIDGIANATDEYPMAFDKQVESVDDGPAGPEISEREGPGKYFWTIGGIAVGMTLIFIAVSFMSSWTRNVGTAPEK